MFIIDLAYLLQLCVYVLVCKEDTYLRLRIQGWARCMVVKHRIFMVIVA